MGILEVDTIKQVEMKEKIKKEYLRRTRQLYCRTKHLGCLPHKIVGTILEVDEGRTSTNESENKKTNDDAQGLTLERWHRLDVSRTERGRGLASIGDSVVASIRRPEDYLKRAKTNDSDQKQHKHHKDQQNNND